jgi:hypothetical protein
MKKFVVGWALIGGMALYALLAGAKQLAEWPRRERASATTSTDELPPAQPGRLAGANSAVDSRSD